MTRFNTFCLVNHSVHFGSPLSRWGEGAHVRDCGYIRSARRSVTILSDPQQQISSPTGQWSEPITSGDIQAFVTRFLKSSVTKK